jgi:hypothetical protein
MELKESSNQKADLVNDNHTESEAACERDKESQEDDQFEENVGSKDKLHGALISEVKGSKLKEQSKFSEEFIKPVLPEAWDIGVPNIFPNPLFNTFSAYQTQSGQGRLTSESYLKNIDFSEKFSLGQADKKNKNIFFKTTKKNYQLDQKIKQISQISSNEQSCSRFISKENFQEERQFLTKKTKFKENNIDFLLCNYFIYYSLNIYLFLAASEILIKNGVLDEIEEAIKHAEKIGHIREEKEKKFIDLVDADSSNSNSNSSTKFHNNKKISKRKCQNSVCESQHKKVSRVGSVILSKRHGVNWLCKLCLDAYNQNKYCYYCYFIYHSATNDKKSWIQCDFCPFWV